MTYRVKDFYQKYQTNLKLELFSNEKGLEKTIKNPEIQRPGLSLSGYLKNYKPNRILVIGKTEIQYLKELDSKKRLIILDEILTHDTPFVIIARKINPLKEIKVVCEKKDISLFKSDIETQLLISKMIIALCYEFSSTTNVHGTLVDVFSMGVLIQGESQAGKSETALELLEKGHRLISDDVVKIRKKDNNFLIGSGPKLTSHLMEIKNIGIINVFNLYGAMCVKENIVLDLVIKLEAFDSNQFDNRSLQKEQFLDILGIKIPFYQVFVKPSRNIALLIETLSLNQRLKKSGLDSAKEFNIKLLQKIVKREKSEIS